MENQLFIIGIGTETDEYENFEETILKGVKRNELEGQIGPDILDNCCSDVCYFWGRSKETIYEKKIDKGDMVLFYVGKRISRNKVDLNQETAVYLGIICETVEISENDVSFLNDFWRKGENFRFLMFFKKKPEKLHHSINEINSKLGYNPDYFPIAGYVKPERMSGVYDILKNILKKRDILKESDSMNESAGHNIKEDYFRVDMLLNKKGQVILYGPPGTGKTWIARKYVVEETNEKTPGNKWEFITFHQSYSYEEFIEGFRPKTDDNGNIRYEVEDGIFKKMAIKAIWSAIAQNPKTSFESIWREFMEQYPEGSILKTLNGKQLKIVKYTPKNLILYSLRKNGEYTISINKLRKFWETGIYIGSNESIYIAIYRILESLNRHQDYEEIKKLVLEYLESGKPIDFSNAPKFYLIIDEINRGNISKIFGELITLLEKDKRLGGENQLIVRLPYSGEPFAVPPNLYIIGTMNTADRSIALLDVALRRRFAFIEVEPRPEFLEKENLKKIREKKLKTEERQRLNEKLNELFSKLDKDNYFLKTLLEKINVRITVVKDRDHRIGHSYFLNVETVDDLKHVWYYEVLPLLMEYFYNDWETIKWVLNEKNKNSGDVFFEKLELTGPNGEEAYQLNVLEGDAFVGALKRIISKNTPSQEGGATTNEENSPENSQSQTEGD